MTLELKYKDENFVYYFEDGRADVLSEVYLKPEDYKRLSSLNSLAITIPCFAMAKEIVKVGVKLGNCEGCSGPLDNDGVGGSPDCDGVGGCVGEWKAFTPKFIAHSGSGFCKSTIIILLRISKV